MDDTKSFTTGLQKILFAVTLSTEELVTVTRIDRVILFKETPLSNCTTLITVRIVISVELKFGENSFAKGHDVAFCQT